jgi:hydroxymethylpyrimidine/phosphomethylpyrimidine kinase
VPQAHVLMLSQVELARMAETWREGGGESPPCADVGRTDRPSAANSCWSPAPAAAGRRALPTPCSTTDGVVATTVLAAPARALHRRRQHLSAALAAFMARGLDVPRSGGGGQEYTVGALPRAALRHGQAGAQQTFFPSRCPRGHA